MNNDRFLRACRREETDCTPVWLMRQAGRYMPEYRAVRERYGFLQMVKTPEVATEITLQPVKAFDVDAAIIFADILPPLEGMGFQLTYEQGEGPVIHNPLRTPADVTALRDADPRETVAYTIEAVRQTKRVLGDTIPLIGFSGAPFTLASYAIEGGGSRDFKRTKLLMYNQPELWHALMGKLTTLVSAYLLAQAEAGADALQIFDSWAGALAPADYAEYVLPYVQQVIEVVKNREPRTENREPSIQKQNSDSSEGGSQFSVLGSPPIIYFGTDMSGLLPLLRQTNADVLGADWRIYLDDAWAQIGPGFAIQGNLDPHVLFASWPQVERRAADVLDRAAGRPGHIFNLGHGILQETPVENVQRLVEFVHARTKN